MGEKDSKMIYIYLRGKVRANKTGIDLFIDFFNNVENCLKNDTIHDFSVWL